MRNRSTSRPDIQFRSFDVRAKDDGAGFSGHAAHFGSVDSYGTAFKKGAFKKTLSDRRGRVPVLFQHNADWPIGKPDTLEEDTQGLAVDVTIVEELERGAEAMALLRNEVPMGLSFGFQTIKSRYIEEADDLDFTNAPDWYKDPEGREYVRVIEEVRLWEISLVTFPANDNATIDAVRSELELDALSSTLEHLRAGTLTERHHALIAELVAASQRGHEPKPDPKAGTTPLDPEVARRDRESVLVSIAAQCGMTVEQLTCVA